MTESKFLDLSYDIENDMPVYPGDTPVVLKQKCFIKKDLYNAWIIQAGMHSGTHIDAPSHLLPDERSIGDFPLSNFIAKGLLFDVRGEKIIDYKQEYGNIDISEHAVLFYTGFDKHYGSQIYYEEQPVLSTRLAEFLVSKKVKLVGIDMPSPDLAPFSIHKILLSNNIFIIENLTGLSQLIDKQFIFYAVPLKIHAESSLIRAYAQVL
ncbi:MAG: cyclase family protein [Bacillota bacterium]|nr:cyclase family protein [Bacillota bacterium]